jgi:hypothetical protein
VLYAQLPSQVAKYARLQVVLAAYQILFLIYRIINAITAQIIFLVVHIVLVIQYVYHAKMVTIYLTILANIVHLFLAVFIALMKINVPFVNNLISFLLMIADVTNAKILLMPVILVLIILHVLLV